jgi:hemerythrin-like domain-containing protein
MFFSSQLINALKEDHDLIRTYLMGVRDLELQLSTRQLSFSELAPILKSHSDREDKVVYNFMRSIPELRERAEEGNEEHKIIDQLASQLKLPLPSDTWIAKVNVFTTILERHLDEEEDHVFSKIKRHLDADLDEDLARRYLEGRPDFIRQPETDVNPAAYPAASGDAWISWINRF